MKRFVLLVSSLILAALISEFVIAKVISYPPYGVAYKVRYRRGGEHWSNIRKPHAKLYNVEGKELLSFNNLGLPGTDVTDLEQPVAVLGSSFVEALQYQPELIATSIFHKNLTQNGWPQSVLNMGCSGHDPYDSWFRLRYFEQKLDFKPSVVMLVLNSDNVAWFKRHPMPLDFDTPDDFGTVNTSRTFRMGLLIRNTSSLFEVYYKGLLKNSTADENTLEEEPTSGSKTHLSTKFSQELQSCLDAYHDRYSVFVILSILDDPFFNKELTEYCQDRGIKCWVDPIMVPANMINGTGHLNQQGNKALGEALYDAYAGSQLPISREKDSDVNEDFFVNTSRNQ